jgi:hypothetical protein
MIRTSSQSACVSWLRSALSITSRPVTQISATAAACEPTARRIEMMIPSRYGRRNPSSRKKVVR